MTDCEPICSQLILTKNAQQKKQKRERGVCAISMQYNDILFLTQLYQCSQFRSKTLSFMKHCYVCKTKLKK